MVTAAVVPATVVAAMMSAVMSPVMVVPVVATVMIVVVVMTAMMVIMVMIAMMVVAMMVVAMMVVAVVVVAAVMMPTMPALAAAKADANNQFVADDVPARAIPAIVVPTVGIAIPHVFDVAARGHDLRVDLRQGPAGVCRRRDALDDRLEAVRNNAVPGAGAVVHKARLHTGGFDLIARVGPGRLGGGRQRKQHQAGDPDELRRQLASRRHTGIGHGSDSFAVSICRL
jgi:hypothetical protein